MGVRSGRWLFGSDEGGSEGGGRVGKQGSEVGRGTREHGVEGTAKTMSARRRAQTRRRARGYPTMNKMG